MPPLGDGIRILTLNPRGPDLNALPGTLHWTDIPDAKPLNPLVVQRRIVEVQDQKGLLGILAENGCSFQREAVLVSFAYVRDNVQFVFERYYPVPHATFVPELQQQPTGVLEPRPAPLLPPAAALEPLGAGSVWLLTARCHVLEEGQPELVARGVEDLAGVAAELQGVFRFRPVDRRRLDTRVPLSRELQPPPPLPQTQAVGR